MKLTENCHEYKQKRELFEMIITTVCTDKTLNYPLLSNFTIGKIISSIETPPC
jgi:hypothetical protein